MAIIKNKELKEKNIDEGYEHRTKQKFNEARSNFRVKHKLSIFNPNTEKLYPSKISNKETFIKSLKSKNKEHLKKALDNAKK